MAGGRVDCAFMLDRVAGLGAKFESALSDEKIRW
jgi:hypothetical protein